jgi:radical SAM protein with 4Fe4S-binding SPASM domain
MLRHLKRLATTRASAVAARALGAVRSQARRARIEPFGAIVQLVRPRALVFVDRDRARSLGLAGDTHPRWRDPADDGAVGRSVLSAPLEAHLQLTNRCGAGCRGCYTAATPRGDRDEWGLAEWMVAIDRLADMGVFHLALGGGESATLPWLGDIARHARARGLVPNLTTSGLEGLDRLLPIADLFGQINVSLDGLDDAYAAVRGFDGFARADRAIAALRAVKRQIGINVVVTRHNFDQLDQIFAYARRRRLNEIELLRFKPAGRGTRAFAGATCSDDQHRRFLPTVLASCRRHRVRVRVDCSYTPMIAHHSPDRALLAKLAVYGGDFLIGAKAAGFLTACSFAEPPAERPTVDAIDAYWAKDDAFGAFRDWENAAEPCSSCPYHQLCRGGCRVVSRHVLGDDTAPDPECPRVVDHRRATGKPEDEAERKPVRLPVLI